MTSSRTPFGSILASTLLVGSGLLLPASSSGTYFAAGALVGSTLMIDEQCTTVHEPP